MASAGRVLPLPKGAYSSSTTYHLLDFVSYQGSTYICKQTSTGNAPTNTTYWQIMAQGTESASVAGNYYGTCSTGASTSAKIVSIPATENFVLQVGDIIGIKFDYTNTANNPSLNVNNSGAKPIYYNNSAVSTSNLWASGEANRVTIFMYDGTNWIWMGHDVDIDTDTLSDLKDTTISSASNGQVLMYDSASSKWKNQTPTTTLAGLSDTQISSATDGQVLKYNSTSQKWVNGEDKGGILPHLIVISETGSTVTAAKGQTVITATETSTGHYECDLSEFGTWTIDAILGGDDAQVSLVVDTVKVYTVDDSHFHADITVKYPSGATCRLQSTSETLYATGSPYTFTVHHAETYTITVTYNQRIYTDTVTFTTEGQSFSKTLPSPSQADANDLNSWLWYGGVSGEYSSLDDILANNSALATLMSSHDAVDYLVRCKDWIVKDPLVPTMTTNTTPSGVCSASSVRSSGYEAYKAFDGDSTTAWQSNSSTSNEWVQYEFPTACVVKHLHTRVMHNGYASAAPSLALTIKGSNDGTNFTDLGTGTAVFSETGNVGVTAVSVDLSFNNSVAYKYYRFNLYTSANCTKMIYDLQFYFENGITDDQNAMNYIGLNDYCADTLLADDDWLDGICDSIYFESVLHDKIPSMTSNTAPSGQASANNFYQGYPAYQAFDGNDNNFGWASAAGAVGSYVQYMFATDGICARKTKFFHKGSAPQTIFKIQGSNNGTDFTDIVTGLVLPPTANTAKYYNFTNNTKYKYYRFTITGGADQSAGNGSKFQLYGRA